MILSNLWIPTEFSNHNEFYHNTVISGLLYMSQVTFSYQYVLQIKFPRESSFETSESNWGHVDQNEIEIVIQFLPPLTLKKSFETRPKALNSNKQVSIKPGKHNEMIFIHLKKWSSLKFFAPFPRGIPCLLNSKPSQNIQKYYFTV